MSTIKEQVIQLIATQLGVKEEEVTPEKSLVDDLGADNEDTLELKMALEDHFGIEIPDEEVQRIRTIQHAIDYTLARK
ncbi:MULTISPECIES: acyl carrier protein [unclassified Streptomyces]|uniref:acyl carrier protein n=1 Tax=unclassified Streptomyces TaxID=2593676 RepID=UPI002E76FEC5|nr:acyl carrier protein [Streptomyces sp. JV184]MEE1746789.1 acyl carrier protein [Streptomyces sp. JV184]